MLLAAPPTAPDAGSAGESVVPERARVGVAFGGREVRQQRFGVSLQPLQPGGAFVAEALVQVARSEFGEEGLAAREPRCRPSSLLDGVENVTERAIGETGPRVTPHGRQQERLRASRVLGR